MLRSIATVCLSGTLLEKLEAASAARFDAVEIFENDLLHFPGAPDEVRRIAADLGLSIALYQPFRDFEACPRERLQRNLDRAERKFDVMQALGASMMLICSSVAPDTIGDDALAAEDLGRLAERAALRGIKLGYEALAWGRQVRDYRHAWRIVDRANHPSLGLIVDSFHSLAIDDDLAELGRIPSERIFFVQIADAPRLQMDLLSWSRHFRCFPGQGQLDVPGFLAPIVANGYGGPLSLEIFNDDFRSASTRRTAIDGMRSLQYLEEKTGELLAAAKPAPPARRTADLFSPPPAPAYRGLEFLEFAIDEESGPRLERWLGRLGFARLGRHKSKNVTLYRQGSVNLILDAEPDSFAHAFFLLHGPSVCAMAFGVDHKQQALNRARLYHAQPFEGRVGPNELVIPAIRAPDGSLIYLVEQHEGAASIYEVDFVLEAATAAAPEAGLQRIDHVALALPGGELDSWLLFYKAIFGFEADDMLALPDPYGMVRSRAVKSRCNSIRLPLNISESRNTATARSLSIYSGAGVNHIALSTSDILASAQHLAAAGVPLLAIPDNYYDDLAARHGLAEATVEQLRRLRILYDRSPDGEYFQLYTEPFEDRFCFEIVERRGYRDYGAANAPVRMAAQAQARSGADLEAWAQAL
ncbi:MAG TPA: bifunctional sugar phosphate isomerase/epimerase/4-hydroxyphenylpyruvate dioxygenase family protein [Stellaceae bacterium]|nr:bifunctional sugar phosphate isomerase/epimerase/4-hydroxyphenylpyruvate dioxygenase family protein [Stellaceae bacterium]